MKRKLLPSIFSSKSKLAASNKNRERVRFAASLRCEQLEDRRLMAAGVLDTTFGTGGEVVTPVAGSEFLMSVAVQSSDGKIVAVGITDNNSNGKFVAVRYNTDGSLDSAFGVGGRAVVDFTAGNDTANDVAIQPDGKIVVVGRISTGGADSAMMRLNSDGSLDNSFGVGGKLVVPANATQTDFFSSVAVDAHGRLVVSGIVFSASTQADMSVSRFLQDGTADTTFGVGGRTLINFQSVGSTSNTDIAESVLVDSAGRIVIGGYTSYTNLQSASVSEFALVRLLADGTLDASFSGDGRATASLTGLLGNSGTATLGYAIAEQPAGKVIIAGGHTASSSRFALARFDTDGSLDNSFGTGGRVMTLIPNTNHSRAEFVAVQSNGKIVAVGTGSSNTQRFFVVSRYNTNGILDSTFGNGGVATTTFTAGASSGDLAMDGALQEDGRIIAAGHVGQINDTDFALARFQGDPIPVNAGGPYFVAESGSVTLNGVASDSAPPAPVFAWDLDGDNIYGEIGLDAGRGDEIGSNPTFNAAGLDGPTSMTVSLRVSDLGEPDQFDTAIINIVNAVPIAGNDVASTDEEQMVTIPVLANDSDIAGAADPLTIVSVGGATKGVATIDNSSGVIHYVPNLNETGIDTLTYTISDGDGGTATASVEITIRNLVDFSGRVFVDANNDGIYSTMDGDTGLEGVTIDVVNESTMQVVFTGVTDVDGVYILNSNLDAGMYRLVKTSSFRSITNLLDGMESAGNLGGVVDNANESNTIEGIDLEPALPAFDAVDYLFAAIEPSTLMGFVWKDFNADGLIDFNEQSIGGVQVELNGIDDRGATVSGVLDITDSDGAYAFLNLRPGTYSINEYQPAGFIDGAENLGTVNGMPVGSVSDDIFSAVQLPLPDSTGQNYNFGERPHSSGSVANSSQSASIGFWQNKNGRNLILSLNGSANSTQLGDWLAATFPNMYGANTGANNLAGMTNLQVSDFYESVFKRNKKTAAGGGPPKVDAQVLATAFAIYVTNSSLAGNGAASYGFQVTGDGMATKTFNVGNGGAAFGVADHSNVQILDLLLAVNARSTNGLLFDMNGDSDTNETLFRQIANDVFEAINDSGRS
jgi:uncharacterized delta-60 repeat protein